MDRPRLRLVRLALAVFVAGTAAVALPGRASIPVCPSAVTVQRDLWEQITPPAFTDVPATITSYALDPGTDDHLIATNGSEVFFSTDAGCSWHQSSLPEPTPAPAAVGGELGVVVRSALRDIEVGGPFGDVYALGATTLSVSGSPVSQPRVLISSDGGSSFAAASGLPTLGEPIAIRSVAPGQAVLLFRDGSPQQGESIYVTSDHGRTWTRTGSNLPTLKGLQLGLDSAGLALWAWSSSTLYRSGDLGAHFVAVDGVPQGVRAVDVSPVSIPGRSRISVFLDSGRERYVSDDAGKTFRTAPAPQGVTSVTHGPLPGFLVLSSRQVNVDIEPPTAAHRAPYDASPGAANVGNVQLSRVAGPFGYVLYASSPSPNALWRLRIPLTFPKLPPPVLVPPVSARAVVRRAPSLAPDLRVITLRPGEHRRVPYRLFLPPTPTPLDIYFMTDSTNSMGGAIHDVQESVQQIVDDLVANGLDIEFGIADFRDYVNATAPPQTANYPYLRRRAIGPINAGLSDALASITAGGGTADGNDSGLEALYQAATGAGRLDPTDPTGTRWLIQPNQGAEFRKNALKVVMIAADDEFRHPGLDDPGGRPSPGYPGPALQTVETTLASLGVHVVGIRVDTNSGNPSADMRALAAATHTFATGRGVDCDGDGTIDVRPGAPLVCPYSPDSDLGITPAFTGLLESLRDLASVDLGVVGPRDVVRALSATTFRDVNVKAPNTLRMPLEFSCLPAHYGTDATVGVTASARGSELAHFPIDVRCLAPSRPPLAPPAAALAAVALVPPPGPGPGQPNINPQINPQAQANPGLATAEDEQTQLATADGDIATDDDALEMSALRRDDSTATGLFVATAALMTAAAAGCCMHVARRKQWGSP